MHMKQLKMLFQVIQSSSLNKGVLNSYNFIKKKLAEKKAVIEQRDKAERTSPEKETEKKLQREM